MMIKVFTTDKNGKITLTAKELKELLDEAYWEGYRNNNHSWTYTTPSWSPYYYTTTTDNITISTSADAKPNTVTINASDLTSGTITSNNVDYNSNLKYNEFHG